MKLGGEPVGRSLPRSKRKVRKKGAQIDHRGTGRKANGDLRGSVRATRVASALGVTRVGRSLPATSGKVAKKLAADTALQKVSATPRVVRKPAGKAVVLAAEVARREAAKGEKGGGAPKTVAERLFRGYTGSKPRYGKAPAKNAPKDGEKGHHRSVDELAGNFGNEAKDTVTGIPKTFETGALVLEGAAHKYLGLDHKVERPLVPADKPNKARTRTADGRKIRKVRKVEAGNKTPSPRGYQGKPTLMVEESALEHKATNRNRDRAFETTRKGISDGFIGQGVRTTTELARAGEAYSRGDQKSAGKHLKNADSRLNKTADAAYHQPLGAVTTFLGAGKVLGTAAGVAGRTAATLKHLPKGRDVVKIGPNAEEVTVKTRKPVTKNESRARPSRRKREEKPQLDQPQFSSGKDGVTPRGPDAKPRKSGRAAAKEQKALVKDAQLRQRSELDNAPAKYSKGFYVRQVQKATDRIAPRLTGEARRVESRVATKRRLKAGTVAIDAETQVSERVREADVAEAYKAAAKTSRAKPARRQGSKAGINEALAALAQPNPPLMKAIVRDSGTGRGEATVRELSTNRQLTSRRASESRAALEAHVALPGRRTSAWREERRKLRTELKRDEAALATVDRVIKAVRSGRVKPDHRHQAFANEMGRLHAESDARQNTSGLFPDSALASEGAMAGRPVGSTETNMKAAIASGVAQPKGHKTPLQLETTTGGGRTDTPDIPVKTGQADSTRRRTGRRKPPKDEARQPVSVDLEGVPHPDRGGEAKARAATQPTTPAPAPPKTVKPTFVEPPPPKPGGVVASVDDIVLIGESRDLNRRLNDGTITPEQRARLDEVDDQLDKVLEENPRDSLRRHVVTSSRKPGSKERPNAAYDRIAPALDDPRFVDGDPATRRKLAAAIAKVEEANWRSENRQRAVVETSDLDRANAAAAPRSVTPEGDLATDKVVEDIAAGQSRPAEPPKSPKGPEGMVQVHIGAAQRGGRSKDPVAMYRDANGADVSGKRAGEPGVRRQLDWSKAEDDGIEPAIQRLEVELSRAATPLDVTSIVIDIADGVREAFRRDLNNPERASGLTRPGSARDTPGNISGFVTPGDPESALRNAFTLDAEQARTGLHAVVGSNPAQKEAYLRLGIAQANDDAQTLDFLASQDLDSLHIKTGNPELSHLAEARILVSLAKLYKRHGRGIGFAEFARGARTVGRYDRPGQKRGTPIGDAVEAELDLQRQALRDRALAASTDKPEGKRARRYPPRNRHEAGQRAIDEKIADELNSDKPLDDPVSFLVDLEDEIKGAERDYDGQDAPDDTGFDSFDPSVMDDPAFGDNLPASFMDAEHDYGDMASPGQDVPNAGPDDFPSDESFIDPAAVTDKQKDNAFRDLSEEYRGAEYGERASPGLQGQRIFTAEPGTPKSRKEVDRFYYEAQAGDYHAILPHRPSPRGRVGSDASDPAIGTKTGYESDIGIPGGLRALLDTTRKHNRRINRKDFFIGVMQMVAHHFERSDGHLDSVGNPSSIAHKRLVQGGDVQPMLVDEANAIIREHSRTGNRLARIDYGKTEDANGKPIAASYVVPEWAKRYIDMKYAEPGQLRTALRAFHAVFIHSVLPLSLGWQLLNPFDHLYRAAGLMNRDAFGIRAAGKTEAAIADRLEALAREGRNASLYERFGAGSGTHAGAQRKGGEALIADMRGGVKNPVSATLRVTGKPGAMVGSPVAKLTDAGLNLAGHIDHWFATPNRRMAFVEWAREMGIDHKRMQSDLRYQNALIRKMEDDPSVLRTLQDKQLEMIGSYGRRTSFEARITEWVPFYTWLRETTKFLLKTLPERSPMRTLLLLQMVSWTLPYRASQGQSDYFSTNEYDAAGITKASRRQMGEVRVLGYNIPFANASGLSTATGAIADVGGLVAEQDLHALTNILPGVTRPVYQSFVNPDDLSLSLSPEGVQKQWYTLMKGLVQGQGGPILSAAVGAYDPKGPVGGLHLQKDNVSYEMNRKVTKTVSSEPWLRKDGHTSPKPTVLQRLGGLIKAPGGGTFPAARLKPGDAGYLRQQQALKMNLGGRDPLTRKFLQQDGMSVRESEKYQQMPDPEVYRMKPWMNPLQPSYDPKGLKFRAKDALNPTAKASSLKGGPKGPAFAEKLISAASVEYGVDPALIRAVMRAESDFNPGSGSSAGAQGLMQLMPFNAKGIDINNNHDNVFRGVSMIHDLLKRYKGNIPLALAGYNAGEGAVQQAGNKVPNYPETQAYVKKIMAEIGGTSRIGVGSGVVKNGSTTLVDWVTRQVGTKEGSARQRWFASQLGVDPAAPWCSVFVGVALKQLGVQIPANPAYSGAWLDWKGGTKVHKADIKPGDLIIYDWGDGGITDHVAIYTGHGQRIGGNQSDAVTRAPAALESAVGIIRPKMTGKLTSSDLAAGSDLPMSAAGDYLATSGGAAASNTTGDYTPHDIAAAADSGSTGGTPIMDALESGGMDALMRALKKKRPVK